MNGKERFIAALTGGMPDRVPIFDFIDSTAFIERATGRKPEEYRAKDIMEATLTYGFDGAFIGFGGFGGVEMDPEARATEPFCQKGHPQPEITHYSDCL